MRIIGRFCKNLPQLNGAIERFVAKSRQHVVAHQEQKAQGPSPECKSLGSGADALNNCAKSRCRRLV